MPTRDSNGALVVRIVYDGAPLAGKTTSLRRLAKELGIEVVTPGERAGRTLFFDWAEYSGGRFDGHAIRCQIVTVPGQRTLADRRARLLDEADAIVFVADTRESEVETVYAMLEELVPSTRDRHPPVGIVLQANYRDSETAVSRGSIRRRLDTIAPLAIAETRALEGEGVRAAFVLAVRLALDRVRALLGEGLLDPGEGTSPDELLESLADTEGPRDWLDPFATTAAGERAAIADAPVEFPVRPGAERSGSGGSSEPPETARERASRASFGPRGTANYATLEPADDTEERPFVPDSSVEGGLIWPPIDGRAILDDAAAFELRASRRTSGDWSGAAAGWRIYSSRNHIYESREWGQQALVRAARMQASHADVLSRGRALVLAEAGGARWRLWQIIRQAPALRDRLMAADTLEDFATLLARAEHAWAEVHERLALPPSLWVVGLDGDSGARYVGALGRVHDAEEPVTLERELELVLHQRLTEGSDAVTLRAALEEAKAGAALRALSAAAASSAARSA